MIRTILPLLLTTVSIPFNMLGQEDTSSIISQIREKSKLVDRILNEEQFRFQFVLTTIVKDSAAVNLTTESHLHNRYHYPASTVKLPVALLTMEKLNTHSLSLESIPKIHRDVHCGNMTYVDRSESGTIDFKEMIRELIVVSDNHYFNTLFHYLTPTVIREKLQKKGLNSTKIYRCFNGCEFPGSLLTNGLHITDNELRKTHYQAPSRMDLSEFSAAYVYDSTKLLGSKHEYRRDIVPGPFDFNYNLDFPLDELHETMVRLVFPGQFDEEQQWHIRAEDRDFLMKSLREVPSDLRKSQYTETKHYPDNVFKYIVKGDNNPAYDHVISYSKIGISYGFVTETAYVVDTKRGIEYVLTASIYVNANDVVNDGIYEYEAIARPALAQFGQLILEALSE